MKHRNRIGLFIILMATILSCKKNDPQNNGANWTEELKGSAWAGEFQLTSGPYQGLQTFSIIMNGNNTLTWYDAAGTLSAVWSVDADKLTITFTNGESFSATVTKEAWSNFVNLNVNARKLANLSRTTIPQPSALENSVWQGKSSSGTDVKMTFKPGSKLQYFLAIDIPYTVFGAGLKITNYAPATISSVGYLIPINNYMRMYQSQSDFGGTSYATWSATKQ